MNLNETVWPFAQLPPTAQGIIKESEKPFPVQFEDGLKALVVTHRYEKLFELDGETDWHPWVQGIQSVMLMGMMAFFTTNEIQEALTTNPRKSGYGVKLILEFPENKFQATFAIVKYTEEQYAAKMDDDDHILCEIVLGQHKHPDGLGGQKAFWGKWDKSYYPLMKIGEEVDEKRMLKIFEAVSPQFAEKHKILEIF